MGENVPQEKQNQKKRPWWKKGIRIFGWAVSVLIIILILLLLFIRSPWGQDIIKNKITHYISDKAHTEVAIDHLYVTFSGKIDLGGLYIEDQQGDTLIYSRELEAAIPLWPIITGSPISVNRVDWNGLYVNIIRKDTAAGFNYQFLMDAFASDSTTAQADTTQSSSFEVASIGRVDLSDFRVNYDDAVTGMKVHLRLGKLHFQGKNIDLEKAKYENSEIALKNTALSYTQTKPLPPETEEDTTAALSFLSVDNFKLKNITLRYQSVPDGMTANVHLSDFLLQLPKADLAHQDIKIKQMALKNSTIKVKAQEAAAVQDSSAAETGKNNGEETFSWPDWNVQVGTLALQNNHLLYQIGKKPENLNGFNPDYINLKDFTLKVDDILLSKNEQLKADLAAFSFREASGPTLKQLTFDLTMDSQHFNINNFNLKVDHSSLAANLDIQYSSVDDFINQPQNSELTVDLSHFSLDLNDFIQLQSDLKSNEFLQQLSRKKITGSVKMKGSMARMNVPEFLVKWGKNTQIKTYGQFRNLAGSDSLWIGIDDFGFKTTRKDITALIPEDSLSMSVPDSITINSQIHGSLDNMEAKIGLITSDGNVKLKGRYKNTDKIAFNVALNIDDLKLGKILENPTIGPVAMTLKTSGQGTSVNDLTAELHSNISELEINNYDYSALQLRGNMEGGKGRIKLDFKDHNLDLDVLSTLEIDSAGQKVAVDFNLHGADLKALGLTSRKLKARLLMSANANIQNGNIDLKSQVNEGTVVYDKETYRLGKVNLSARLHTDSTSVNISSHFLNMKLRSNADMNHISSALGRQINHYFSDSTQAVDSTHQPVRLKLTMDFHPNDLLTEVFAPSIQSMDTLKLDVDFNQKKNLLTTTMSLPHLDYAGKTIDSLGLKLTSTAKAGKFIFGFKQLDAGDFVMNPTYLNGNFKDGVLTVKFNSLNDKYKPFYAVQAQISGKNNNLKVHIVPENLLVGGNTWNIPEDNRLLFQKDKITARHFVFSRGEQTVKIVNNLIDIEKNNIGIGFHNFSLSNIMALFNEDNYLAEGQLQGNIVAVNPLDNIGFIADFGIDSLKVLQAPLGDLSLKANSKKENHYNFSMSLKGSDVDLGLHGNYIADQNSQFNLTLGINKFGFETIDKISGGSIENGTGYLSGKLTAKGSVTSPKYHGFIKFNDGSLKVASLNSTFYLSDDKIEFDNNGIRFNNFSIADENRHQLVIDGSISTENITNPKFDLSVSADNFQAMNSTSKNSEDYYGTLNFDASGTVTGSMNFPKVDMDIRINKGTNLTYVLSSSQAAMKSRKGIVEFVNKTHPESILTRDNDSTNALELTGIQLHTRLNIDKEATFSVIVNPQTGDNFEISGESALDFNIAPNGRMTLSGRYVVNQGHYKLTLFNLVNRKFYLKKGSTITWSGDPMGAKLDVTAIYKLETSASGLMAAQIAGASSSEQNKYKQVLPFWVLMNINGTIENPELSFGLTMPEEAQGAVSGSVYARTKQLSQNPSALNKQVFSLLVLNRFYPVPGSDGSQGGVASIARNSLNKILSEQLNAFSDRLMGDTGVKLNFGLESYTDYQGRSPQARTDLNITAQKKLFNERLVVKAGTDVNVQGEARPGEKNPLLGNVSIGYLLTKDGRWRLKGFRKNEYENIIDGQVYVNGIGVVFQYQFNQFVELWKHFFGETEEGEKEKQTGLSANGNAVPTENKTSETEKNNH